MQYNKGDIVLIQFPFTTLGQAKKRPVLIIKKPNKHHDFVCFQITSKSTQTHLFSIENNHIQSGCLKFSSFVKYDKCFTLNSKLIEKSLATVNTDFLTKATQLFCNILSQRI